MLEKLETRLGHARGTNPATSQRHRQGQSRVTVPAKRNEIQIKGMNGNRRLCAACFFFSSLSCLSVSSARIAGLDRIRGGVHHPDIHLRRQLGREEGNIAVMAVTMTPTCIARLVRSDGLTTQITAGGPYRDRTCDPGIKSSTYAVILCFSMCPLILNKSLCYAKSCCSWRFIEIVACARATRLFVD